MGAAYYKLNQETILPSMLKIRNTFAPIKFIKQVMKQVYQLLPNVGCPNVGYDR